MPTIPLPAGVSLQPLAAQRDPAGTDIQLYRGDWHIDPDPVQWNLVSSMQNTLRGVHVHIRHWDYLHVARGEMLLGLCDMRPWSTTHTLSAQVTLNGDTPAALAIPPGVAHGFYFAGAIDYLYAVSHYWNEEDELGCRWNDPRLSLAWPTDDPLLSARDQTAGDYRDLTRQLAQLQARGAFRP